MKITTMTTTLVLFLGALCQACAGQKIEPQVASSATQANYAAEYPGALQSVSNDYVNAEGEVRKNTTDFAKYPEQLQDPPWPVVQGVVTRADVAEYAAHVRALLSFGGEAIVLRAARSGTESSSVKAQTELTRWVGLCRAVTRHVLFRP